LPVGPAIASAPKSFGGRDAAPAQRIDYVVLSAWNEPGSVGILDAQEEIAAVPAGKQGIV
jgi:hypothetical protein